MSKQFAPPPRPGGRPATTAAAQPRPAAPRPPAPQRPCVPPPPAFARPAPTATAQRFASFANRTIDRGARPAPPGDELVPLSGDTFGARNAARGIVSRPDGTYNFVRTEGLRRVDQRTLISAKVGHAQLADGKPVIYAGTARFSGGALDWWSNYSGHYQPIAAFRNQAQLPDEKFVPWQKLQMGGTAMQRNQFRDRRPSVGAPVAKAEPDEKIERKPSAEGNADKPAAAASSASSPPGSGPPGKATTAS